MSSACQTAAEWINGNECNGERCDISRGGCGSNCQFPRPPIMREMRSKCRTNCPENVARIARISAPVDLRASWAWKKNKGTNNKNDGGSLEIHPHRLGSVWKCVLAVWSVLLKCNNYTRVYWPLRERLHHPLWSWDAIRPRNYPFRLCFCRFSICFWFRVPNVSKATFHVWLLLWWPIKFNYHEDIRIRYHVFLFFSSLLSATFVGYVFINKYVKFWIIYKYLLFKFSYFY